jgi:hypothetical protein
LCTPRGRAGVRALSSRRPEPGATLRGEGADDGPRLSCAGDDERAVQDAWREEQRAADAGGVFQARRRPHHARDVLRGARAKHRDDRTLTARTRLFCAALRLQAYLLPDLAARLAPAPDELLPPVHHTWTLEMEIPDKTPCHGQPSGREPAVGDRRRRVAGRRRKLRGQAAEREAARAERAALAPWRAGIGRARLVKRVVLAGWRPERRAKRGQDPVQRGAMGAGAGQEVAAAQRPRATSDGSEMRTAPSPSALRGSTSPASAGEVKIGTRAHVMSDGAGMGGGTLTLAAARLALVRFAAQAREARAR